MKTITIISLCFVSFFLSAQNIELSFTGSGMSDIVASVEALNLNTGESVSLSQGDVLTLVTQATGIDNQIPNDGAFRIYPNPLSDASKIEFNNKISGTVNVEVYDITGKKLLNNKLQLKTGSHMFNISGLRPGMYILNVITPGEKFTTNFLSNSRLSENPAVSYLGSNALSNQKHNLKKVQSSIELSFNVGDRIWLKGVSGNYSRVITLIPTVTAAVNFEFVECLDGEGNHYPVVTIGNWTFMAENLKTSKYRNGDDIGTTTPATLNIDAEDTPKYQWPANGEESNVATYGRLYTWFAVMDERSLCPTGWHVPTDEEWTAFKDYLIANGFNYDGTTEENKIAKSLASRSNWNEYLLTEGAAGNTDYPGMRNATGFNAIPAGRRIRQGSFDSMGSYSNLWTSTETTSGSNPAWYHNIYNQSIALGRSNLHKKTAYSVRCMKDEL